MGFFKNIIKGQLIDVIEWIDDSRDVMVHRYDMNGKDIMMGAQLTVRESQVAIFMNEGQIADVYNPGRHELTTANMPIMTALKSWKFGFNSPFKADVFFLNTRQFLDLKWGTANPVMMRDSDFGVIRLRAYGIYSFRVKDPVLFLKEVFGTNSLFTVSDVEGQLKRVIVSSLSDAIAESKIPAFDLAANYDELGSLALKALQPTAQAMGLELTSFIVENISLPEEVEKTIDKRTSMGVLGDMGRYTQYQAAEAMREAANNPGGGSMAGMGVGMGAGAMMGQMFTQSMHQASQPVSQQQVQPANAACVRCGAAIAPNTKFCPECGASQVPPKCVSCGAMLPPGTKFCPECGAKQ
jgi:membrane protease subunit (stomatin/prohibitin family)